MTYQEIKHNRLQRLDRLQADFLSLELEKDLEVSHHPDLYYMMALRYNCVLSPDGTQWSLSHQSLVTDYNKHLNRLRLAKGKDAHKLLLQAIDGGLHGYCVERFTQSVSRAAACERSMYIALSHLFDLNDQCRYQLFLKLIPAFFVNLGEKWAKSTFAFWAARLLGQECPAKVDGHEPFFYAGVQKKRLLRKCMKRNFELAQAFLVCKKSCAPVDTSFVEATLLKHSQRLGASAPTTKPDWFDAEIKRTVMEVFKNRRFRLRSQAFKIPSMRGHYQTSGTQFGALRELIWNMKDLNPHYSFRIPELACIFEHKARVVPFHSTGFIVGDCLEEAFDRKSMFKMLLNPILCKVVPVLEALKVRVITCGEARPYYLGKYLQSFLWKHLKDHPVFALTGRPQTIEDIDGLVRSTPDGWWWLSGDYEAATDLLCGWASEATWDAICDTCEIDGILRAIGKKLLTEHILDYGKTDSYDPDHMLVTQRTGQLMGSVISFPILCLINACVCRRSIEVASGTRQPLRKLKMFINGDDCLFALPKEGLKTWEDLTKSVGLIKSVGKNYFSEDVLVINSRMYAKNNLLQYQHSEQLVHQVPFVNSGLMTGCGRVQSRSDSLSPEDMAQTGLVSRAWDLVKEAPPWMRDELIAKFCYLNGDDLRKISHSQQSWFLPRFAGGLGLPPPSDFSIEKVSPIARKVCLYLCSLDGQSLPFSMGLETSSVPDFLTVGLREAARIQKELGMRSVIVREDDVDVHCKDKVSQGFAHFCALESENRVGTPSTWFEKCIARAKKFPPCIGLPSFARVVVRPAISFPEILVNTQGLCPNFHEVFREMNLIHTANALACTARFNRRCLQCVTEHVYKGWDKMDATQMNKFSLTNNLCE